MRLRNLRWLLAKEWRELLASRAYWLLLLIVSLLVGQNFISAVNLYAEASGIGGGAAALSQGLSPLDGILVPTFGAYDLVATLLLPFVAIRLIAAEKESGSWKLALQMPVSPGVLLAIKGTVLLLGWLIAWIPGLVALLLWKSYGGHLYAPETLNLLLGHILRMVLSTGIAVVASAFAENAASAAIVTLGFTLGTWALDFLAAGRGGWWQVVAAYTPTAALRVFEHGLLRVSTVLVLLVCSIGGFALAAAWLHTGRSLLRRCAYTAAVVLGIAVMVSLGARARQSWDVSEDHRNSFSRADEATLKQIQKPLRVTIYLAAEDPRLMDLERSILSKLRRLLPRVDVDYAADSRSGLFENEESHYGEIWYQLGDEKALIISTTEPIVLEELYKLASTEPPAPVEEPPYPGYPLAVRPKSAALIFYGLLPLVVGAVWFMTCRNRR